MSETVAESDEAVALRVQLGDREAFGILVERYEKKITRYANKFLYVYEDRQDAVQDVFLKAYQNIQSFQVSERFSPWVYRIAHNTFLNVIRKQGREKISFIETDQIFGSNIKDTEEEEARQQGEEREVLDHCLGKLDVKYREVLVLFYFEEKDYDEIAEILSIPKSTVGVRLRRGRENMRSLYGAVQ